MCNDRIGVIWPQSTPLSHDPLSHPFFFSERNLQWPNSWSRLNYQIYCKVKFKHNIYNAKDMLRLM